MPRGTILDRARFQKLSERYARDAGLLLRAGAWSSAYYLAGYAVECALKACIAKQFRRHQFPDLQFVRDIYTHNLSTLLKQAGLSDELNARTRNADDFGDYWNNVVTGWNESSRYEQPTQAMARELVRAVGDNKAGVLPWIQMHW